MSEYLLAGSALLACLASGVAGMQGVQMVRYRGEGQNVLLAVVAAVAALAGAALFVLTLRSPAAFFTALRHGTTGIAIYLYATLALVAGCVVAIVMAKRSEDGSVARSPAAFFTALRHGTTGIAIYLYATLALVAGCVVAIVMAKRSEDGSVARWVGVLLAVLAIALAFGSALGFLKSAFVKVDGRFWAVFAFFVGLALCLGAFVLLAVLAIALAFGSALGFLKSAFVKVDGRFWAVFAFFVGLALCLGAFAQLLVGALRGDEEARSFGRPASLVGVVALALGTAAFACWLLAGPGAGASGAAKAAFSFNGYTANMGAAAGATAAGQLADLAAGNAALFWGGAVACGLVLPLACGVGAFVTSRRAGEKAVGLALPFGAVGLAAALVGGYCLCLVVGMLV